MTDTLQTLGLVTLAQTFRSDVVRQINRRAEALKFLRIVPGEGKNVAWVAEGDGAVAENYSEGADASNFGSDAQTSAILSWSLYRATFHVSELAMDGAATSQSPVGNRQLWLRNMLNGAGKLASTLNGAVYTGAGTGSLMCGFGEAIAKDDNTYAGIDRSSGGNAFWRPTVVDPGTPTAVTMPFLRDDVRKIYEASGERPDIAFCSPSVFNTVGALFDNTRRYVADTVNTAGRQQKLDFGYQAIELDGMMFVQDKDATAATIFYVNTDYVEIEYLPSAAQKAMLDSIGLRVQADDGFGEVPLGFKYEKLAKTGASEKAEILATLQLKALKPNTCGARKNIA